jgi:chemotaxis protein histidine kinase CheA
MEMDNLKQIFADEIECFLSNFKNLVFELKKDNAKVSREIFMIMHTLKLLSRNFGHEKAGQLLRNLESVYKIARKNNLNVHPDLIASTLITEDYLRDMLTDEEFLNNSDNIERYRMLKAQHASRGSIEKKVWSKPELRQIL